MADTGMQPGEASGVSSDARGGYTLRVEWSVEETGRIKNLKTDKSHGVDLTARVGNQVWNARVKPLPTFKRACLRVGRPAPWLGNRSAWTR